MVHHLQPNPRRAPYRASPSEAIVIRRSYWPCRPYTEGLLPRRRWAAVGYGDHYPITTAGRLVAFGLMIGGIALLGTVTATLASWLVETVAAEKKQAEDLQVMVRRPEDKIGGTP